MPKHPASETVHCHCARRFLPRYTRPTRHTAPKRTRNPKRGVHEQPELRYRRRYHDRLVLAWPSRMGSGKEGARFMMNGCGEINCSLGRAATRACGVSSTPYYRMVFSDMGKPSLNLLDSCLRSSRGLLAFSRHAYRTILLSESRLRFSSCY